MYVAVLDKERPRADVELIWAIGALRVRGGAIAGKHALQHPGLDQVLRSVCPAEPIDADPFAHGTGGFPVLAMAR